MTNQLFREVLEGRIPMPRRQIPPGFYFLPTLADPTAPTMADLNAGIRLDGVVENVEAFTDALHAIGQAALNAMRAAPKYVMPAPSYPTGNIATQKRRRKL